MLSCSTLTIGAALVVVILVHLGSPIKRPRQISRNLNANCEKTSENNEEFPKEEDEASIQHVFLADTANENSDSAAGLKKLMNGMKTMILDPSYLPSSKMKMEIHIMNSKQRNLFVLSHEEECFEDDAGMNRYNNLSESDRKEFWKYCCLVAHGGVYVDSESPLVTSLKEVTSRFKGNLAVLGSGYLNTIHGSLLVISKPKSPVALGMLKVLLLNNKDEDVSLPMHLYRLISSDLGLESIDPGYNHGKQSSSWMILEQRCSFDTDQDTQYSSAIYLTQKCPSGSYKYCCEVIDPCLSSTIMITEHPILPLSEDLPASFPRPYHYNIESDRDHAPFISTVQEEIFPPPLISPNTPNFYHLLESINCLPNSSYCRKCSEKLGFGNDICDKCQVQCKCYCTAICDRVKTKEKFVTKDIIVTPPKYATDPSRLIPRIIHQTWFETVSDIHKYPNLSRLAQSWKSSGWEYKFYDDEDSRDFLFKHFPSEILEAYDTLLPGAFKADLFRYCVLLIEGGVYADVDILLETNLENAIPGDIGFMVPHDRPGGQNHGYCLWNGFMASASGHPFLAKAIEKIVNAVRNRFTILDIENHFCPNTYLQVPHSTPFLHITGPCALGASINDSIGRHMQSTIGIGDVPNDGPGRFVVLKQDKELMGAHRFIWEEHNLLVAVTDLPDFDDKKKLQIEGKHVVPEHYGTTILGLGDHFYGQLHVYRDANAANEDIRIVVRS